MNTTLGSTTDRFIALFHHRWSLPIIAELYKAGGTKFVTLINKLSVSRDSLSRSLKSLAVQQWVMKNPGYGHPMRPEYILTEQGKKIGPVCFELFQKIVQLQMEEIALKKWALPLLHAICRGAQRFSNLREFYPDISPKALTDTLKEMSAAGLIYRVVLETFPPSVEYRVLPKGQEFCPLLSKLVGLFDLLY